MSIFFVFDVTTLKKEADAAACTVTNGVYSEAEIKSGCEATPDLYEIVIYKMYLCTSAPTIPTTSATVVLTNCTQVFNNASGATASVSGTNSDVDLTQTGAGAHVANMKFYTDNYNVNVTQQGSTNQSYSATFNCTSGCTKTITITQQ